LVFFHGYKSDKEAFSAQISYFAKYYRVTAFDFLGFGKSAPISEAFSVSDYAEWTAAVLSKLGVVRPHVVAHSFGCRVAIKLAAKNKEAFDKMILTGPAGVILRRGVGYKSRVFLYRFIKKFAPVFAERRFGSAEYRTLSPIEKESYKKIVNEDLLDDAATIENEVLIVEGREDLTTPKEAAEAYLSRLKKSTMQLIDGGHFAFAEHPVAFNLLVEEFLEHG